jgi:hypothetical protein
VSTSIKLDLRTGVAAIADLVTAGATVDLDTSEQGVDNPRVVMLRTAYRNFPHLGGVDDTLLFETFNFYVFATSTNEAQNLADDIASYVEGLSGNLGASRKVTGTEVQTKSDSFVNDQSGQDVGDYQVLISAEIQHVPQ